MQPTLTDTPAAGDGRALERLMAGKPFPGGDTELLVLRQRARALARQFNEIPANKYLEQIRVLAALFGSLGEAPDVEAPLFVEYGRHIFAGDRLSLGPGCVFYDVGRITLGHDVRLDAGVQLYAVVRPRQAEHRRAGLLQAAPIRIGDDVWIGGGAIITPGTTIGSGSVIAPGSVVSGEIPSGVYAAGSPCVVVKPL